MAASSLNGTFLFWYDGLPFVGINVAANDCGTLKFWQDGLAVTHIFPAAAPAEGSAIITRMMMGMGI